MNFSLLLVVNVKLLNVTYCLLELDFEYEYYDVVLAISLKNLNNFVEI